MRPAIPASPLVHSHGRLAKACVLLAPHPPILRRTSSKRPRAAPADSSAECHAPPQRLLSRAHRVPCSLSCEEDRVGADSASLCHRNALRRTPVPGRVHLRLHGCVRARRLAECALSVVAARCARGCFQRPGDCRPAVRPLRSGDRFLLGRGCPPGRRSRDFPRRVPRAQRSSRPATAQTGAEEGRSAAGQKIPHPDWARTHRPWSTQLQVTANSAGGLPRAGWAERAEAAKDTGDRRCRTSPPPPGRNALVTRFLGRHMRRGRPAAHGARRKKWLGRRPRLERGRNRMTKHKRICRGGGARAVHAAVFSNRSEQRGPQEGWAR
ncbi:hypothetical protein ERJ75_000559900 [Trypanosoma vivax]|nr:hypothetical protein ERJ75_000558900 [Trypanosoma vivax]KAH8615682.1 hypothetical protein ERJ75_000559900 [Trypanosoma vivax]